MQEADSPTQDKGPVKANNSIRVFSTSMRMLSSFYTCLLVMLEADSQTLDKGTDKAGNSIRVCITHTHRSPVICACDIVPVKGGMQDPG